MTRWDDRWGDKREARVRYLLGRLLADVSANECAVDLLGEAIQLDMRLIAAQVELGFVLGRAEDHEEMVLTFREAVRADAQAVRKAVWQEPEELKPLWEILRPEPSVSIQERSRYSPPRPAEFSESEGLVRFAREYIREGRDELAATALRYSLQLDPTLSAATALLALTYLLMKSKGTLGSAIAETEKALRQINPFLAKYLLQS